MEQLDKIFGVTEAGSDVATEIRAGGATFLTMAYILLVNPSMLGATGIPFNDALFATSIAYFSSDVWQWGFGRNYLSL